jgi:N-acetylmuramoyl-L-alanine amidase
MPTPQRQPRPTRRPLPPSVPSHRPASPRVRRRRTITGLGVGVVALAIFSATTRHQPKQAAAQPGFASVTSTQPAPELFAPGACVALPPTSGDRHQTVFLDAGHGGPDPGASGTTTDGRAVVERQLTLPVVIDATTILRADGYRVVVSRTTDSSVARLGPQDLARGGSLSLRGEHDDTKARVTCANLAGADVLLSVHFNAFSDPAARGLLTTYDDSRPFTASNMQFAQLVDTDVLAALHAARWPVPDRGILPDTAVGAPALSDEAHRYGHFLLLGPAAPGWLDQPTTMPGALIEPLFLTNPAEASVAANPAGQRAIASGIASAVETFLTR